MGVRLIFLFLMAGLAWGQHRIVSTAPSITETLYALGLGGRVVGVSTFCHYPPEVARKPRVGTFMTPNAEVIARLRPDLVIVQRVPNSVSEQLRRLGMRVAEVTTGGLAENLDSIRAIAAAAGVPAKGEQLVSSIRAALDKIRARSASGPRRPVLFVVGRAPGRLEGIVAVGRGSYLTELIEYAGGRNVLAESAQAYVKISLETVVRSRPEVIIDMGEMAETTGVTNERKKAVVELWKSRPEISARVFAIADDIYVVPGPRMLDAARALAAMINSEGSK